MIDDPSGTGTLVTRSRRRFVADGLMTGLSLALVGPLWSGCSSSEVESGREGRAAELQAAIARMVGVAIPGPPDSSWPSESEAVDQLLNSLDGEPWPVLIANQRALQDEVQRLARADFNAGRTGYLSGFLVSDTELAIARVAHEGSSP